MGKYYLPLSHLHKVASLQTFSPFQVRQVERKKKEEKKVHHIQNIALLTLTISLTKHSKHYLPFSHYTNGLSFDAILNNCLLFFIIFRYNLLQIISLLIYPYTNYLPFDITLCQLSPF